MEQKGGQNWLWILIVVPVMFILLFLLRDQEFLVDEYDHYQEIAAVTHSEVNQKTFYRVPSLPGYHITLGLLCRIFGDSSRPLARTLSAFFSFLAVLIFYLVAKKIDPSNAITKTLQFFFLPVLFIFHFLIYTESFSLLFLIASFYFVTKNRYKTAGLFGFFSLLIRQNNIVWLGFFALIVTVKELENGLKKKFLAKLSCNLSVFLFSLIALLTFGYFNKGFVLGDPGAHPFGIYYGNFFLFLFIFFFLFLPLNLFYLPRLTRFLRKYPWVILLVIAFFFFYLKNFQSIHHYNNVKYFLRNRLLFYATKRKLTKSLFFLPVIYSLGSLTVTPLLKKKYYLFYPFLFLSLTSASLIEPRYSIVPASFFLLLRKTESPVLEWIITVVFVAFSAWLTLGILNGNFFL